MKTKLYTFHGIEFTGKGETLQAECPICQKQKFFVKQSTGQFNCKVCATEGNQYTFLKLLANYAKEITTTKQLEALAKDRGLKATTLKAWGVSVHPFTENEYLLPVYNHENKIANLCKIVRVQGKWKVYGSPECKMHPFKKTQPTKETNIIWCEGVWDAMALEEMLTGFRIKNAKLIKTTKQDSSTCIVGVPGANTFASEWLSKYGGDRDNFFIFDNDHPKTTAAKQVVQTGWQGLQRIAKQAKEYNPTNSIHFAVWGKDGFDPNIADKADVRDMLNELGPTKALTKIWGLMQKQTIETSSKEEKEITPIDVDNFNQLCTYYSKNLHFTNTMRQALAVALGVCVSTELKGDQLWLRLIGPPGSGKTTIAEALSAAKEHTFPISIQTGFHSGYNAGKTKTIKNGKEEATKDASLIPQMNGKTCIIKDADTLINSPQRDTLLSEMRDFYDGVSRAKYRNRVSHTYENLRITFILCGTDEMRKLNRAFLGERFIDCEILGTEDRKPYLDKAAENAYANILSGLQPEANNEVFGQTTEIKQATVGFLSHLKTQLADKTISIPILSKEADNKLKAFGELLSHLRTKVQREGEGLAYRPRAELATRLVSQMVKLAVSIGMVLGKKTIDNEVLSVVQNVVASTGENFHTDVVKLLAENKEGLSSLQIALTLNLPESSVKRYVDDMRELHLLQRNSKPNNSGVRGRNLHMYTLTKPIAELWGKCFPPKKAQPKPIKKGKK